ncbi:MAG: hypothetical protein M1837_006886 [Sclerophora amabilis]|nr:MAG: hypothetical protein M1837_006886 [Sclerophora amabilis]
MIKRRNAPASTNEQTGASFQGLREGTTSSVFGRASPPRYNFSILDDDRHHAAPSPKEKASLKSLQSQESSSMAPGAKAITGERQPRKSGDAKPLSTTQ